MRICPTCGDPVAGTPRWCPRCAAPLPEPGSGPGPWYGAAPAYPPAAGYPYPPEPGYPPAPGYHYPPDPRYPYPPEPGYAADPGYPADPAYPAAAEYPGQSGYVREAGYAANPGYAAEAGYTGDPGSGAGSGYLAAPGYLPAPLAGYQPGPDRLDPHEPASYQPWVYQRGLGEPAQSERAQYGQGQYEQGRSDPGQYAPGQYAPGQYAPGQYAPGQYAPVRSAPPWEQPDSFGDLFAGGPVTRAFPVRALPGPDGGPDEDTASRLLYPPPSRARRPPRHRAQIVRSALGAAALVTGAVIAWSALGPHQPGPGTRLAGRQTSAAHRAGPAPRGRAAPSAAPSPSVPAPGGAGIMVTMAPGVSQAPDAARVDGFLVSYFTAINAHDYQQYERLLIPARRTQLTAAAFTRGYGTTTDTSASIAGISPTGPGVAVTVTFTSQQRSAPGADAAACTYWDITLYLQNSGGTLLIGNPPHRYHAFHRSCS